MKHPTITKLLGKKEHGGNTYEYVLKSDLYVYQIKNGKPNGWFCSWPAWERTMNVVIL